MKSPSTIDFYFDFISPYAWLASKRLAELDALGHTIVLKPILFAGLLNHHGQKGPAEIVPKRTHTYRQVLWLAHGMGLAMKLPSAHPFNPLPLLRLQLACGNSRESMNRLFDFVWRDGYLPTDIEKFQQLLADCRLDNADIPSLMDASGVKQALRGNTEEAVALELFGVPTFRVHGENFWGLDSIDMLKAWLRDESFFRNAQWKDAASLPVGVTRQ